MSEPQTYSRVKVAIAIPTAGSIRAACAFSTLQLVGAMTQRRFWPEAKEQGLTLLMREGSGIAPNRQKMVDEAIAADCTHVLFIDDDMSFEPQAFASLASRRLPIVGCNYRMRFPPGEFTALHLERERGRMATTAESAGLEPCDYMGFGLCLIETRVFKALEKPYFLGRYIDGIYTTEDLPFYWQAREKGFVAYVDQDASKFISHIGIRTYSWNDEFPAKATPESVSQSVNNPSSDAVGEVPGAQASP